MLPSRIRRTFRGGDKMRILHVLSIVAPRYGGPACELAGFAARMADRGHHVTVLGLTGAAEEAEIRASQWYLSRPNLELVLLPRGIPKRWHFCRNGERNLTRLVAGADVVHAHMIWDYLVLKTARVAKIQNKPLVVSPHGTFNEPWRYAAWHKRLYRTLFFPTLFSAARCCHALTERESQALRTVGYRGPIEVIPAGISYAEPRDQDGTASLGRLALTATPFILFLGRLSPEKNIDGLLAAWNKVVASFPETHLVIAGHCDHSYGRHLRTLAANMPKPDHVRFIGHADEGMRGALLSAARGLVLPSHSEGLSGAVLQALAAGLPIVVTRACGLAESLIQRCGFLCETSAQSVQDGLERLLNASPGQRLAMKREARDAVRTLYSEADHDAKFEALYSGICKTADIPPEIWTLSSTRTTPDTTRDAIHA
jgi:glycosyltransferase involved in cell wall biosynthesis